jgi:Tol biopolymer transport system component
MDAVEPRWSPDGRFITFSTQTTDWRVYIIPAEGGEAVALTEPTHGCCARWSPAGDRLLFWRGSLAGIWTMNPDGTEAGPIDVSRLADAVLAEWSPDGKEVLAEFFTGVIGRVPLEGEEFIILSEDPVDEINRWIR